MCFILISALDIYEKSLKETKETELYKAFIALANISNAECKGASGLLLSEDVFMAWDELDAVVKHGLTHDMISAEFTHHCIVLEEGDRVLNFESFSTLLVRLENIDANSSTDHGDGNNQRVSTVEECVENRHFLHQSIVRDIQDTIRDIAIAQQHQRDNAYRHMQKSIQVRL